MGPDSDADPEVFAARAVEMCALILSFDCIARRGDILAGSSSCSSTLGRVVATSPLQVTSRGTQTTIASDCFAGTAFLPTLQANLWK